MGTCVSKCFFPETPTPTPTKEATKQPSSDSNAAAAVHPHPFSSSTTSSLSLASPSLSSSSAASSSSSSSSSRPRKRDPFLLPNRSRSSSREWDVVVLDPNRKQLTSASSTRPASYSDEHHKNKKPCSPANRIRRATEREALLLRSSAAQACSNKEEAAGSRVPEDDLANPTISMDCFIFL